MQVNIEINSSLNLLKAIGNMQISGAGRAQYLVDNLIKHKLLQNSKSNYISYSISTIHLNDRHNRRHDHILYSSLYTRHSHI